MDLQLLSQYTRLECELSHFELHVSLAEIQTDDYNNPPPLPPYRPMKKQQQYPETLDNHHFKSGQSKGIFVLCLII